MMTKSGFFMELLAFDGTLHDPARSKVARMIGSLRKKSLGTGCRKPRSARRTIVRVDFEAEAQERE
jgi:hypothetical protein